MRLKVEPHEEAKRQYGISGASRQRYSPEEKVRIVVAGLRGEDSVAELCRKELAEVALKELSPLFEQMYSEVGRPSIPPERFAESFAPDGAVHGAQRADVL